MERIVPRFHCWYQPGFRPPSQRSGRRKPCGQMGRLVQMCTSVTSPSTPAATHSLISRAPSSEWPWLPIWVTTPVRAAISFSARASCTV